MVGLGIVAGRIAAGENRAPRSGLGESVRRYVADGMYAGIACGAVGGALILEGRRTLAQPGLPVTADTLFDLASVGKTQTAALCALLAAAGKLDVDAPFTEYLPEHVLAKENCKITVRDLATHSGGFDNSKPYQTPDAGEMFAGLFAKRPVHPRGGKYDYACANFIYLGLIVEKFTGMDLDAAAKKMLWEPLGMRRTTWNTVVNDGNVAEFPRSTYDGPERRPGEHNDLTCHYAPRPFGNGSCFSTAPDLLLFAADMLKREKFPAAYYDLQFTPCFDKGGHRRSFGWDMDAADSTFRQWVATEFSARAICHTGWAGSGIAVDPERGSAAVFLGNRLGSKEQTMPLRMHALDLLCGGKA